MTNEEFKKQQDDWFKRWTAGQVAEHYPCGCVGRIDPETHALVISVDPTCKWDAPKTGQIIGVTRDKGAWLLYVARDSKDGIAARKLPY